MNIDYKDLLELWTCDIEDDKCMIDGCLNCPGVESESLDKELPICIINPSEKGVFSPKILCEP